MRSAGQDNSSPTNNHHKIDERETKGKRRDSVTVRATYTPEEKEDWKINEVYQPIFSLERKGDCYTAIKRYESEVISLAKKSKFETPKRSFCSLAKRGIGNCYMTQRRYEEVERSLEESLKYLPFGLERIILTIP